MKVCRIVNEVDVLGRGWYNQRICYTYTLNRYDLENMVRFKGKITRKSVEKWLDTHAGDFQSIEDFRVTIGDGELDSNFQSEESEITYNSIMYPKE